MFCPKCATENEVQQGYCRQCGQRLSGVRLALEGSADQSLEKLKAGEKWIGGGSATLAAFTVIALAIALLGLAAHDLSFGYIAFLNLVLGSFIGLPLIYFGKSRLKRAARLLTGPQTEQTRANLDQSPRRDDLLTSELNADPSRMRIPGSVAEHTTLDLQRPDRVRRESE
jgi:hypothetical protein